VAKPGRPPRREHQHTFLSTAFAGIPPDFDAAKIIETKHSHLFARGLNETHFDMVAAHFAATLCVELNAVLPFYSFISVGSSEFRGACRIFCFPRRLFLSCPLPSPATAAFDFCTGHPPRPPSQTRPHRQSHRRPRPPTPHLRARRHRRRRLIIIPRSLTRGERKEKKTPRRHRPPHMFSFISRRRSL